MASASELTLTGEGRDCGSAFERLLSLCATAHDAPTNREAWFVTALVVNAFGNILGVMYNPHSRGPELTHP